MNKINFNSAEKKQLTERQEQILGFIQDFIQESGYPPTLREIAKDATTKDYSNYCVQANLVYLHLGTR